ncbi:DUF4019 domain-containing protein [uncultured Desulfosarcina sp.]|uniref:DUF4019 domain-containing protein n=1 Tax=uncultured Desulfosarcina sp. TaxID=218289 RepID=UPI0029C66E77|nr:DUF4019 domain-containing protein [uncultured Desulfosarcina sp.]
MKQVFRFVIIGLFLGATVAMANEAEKKESAIASAEKWLSIVDNGNYAESWQEASEFLKQAVTRDQWEQAVQSVRKPLGKRVSRELIRAAYTTSLPGAPDGEYVVIQFDTSFENKKSGIETVTPMLCKDGKWRISGYYVK